MAQGVFLVARERATCCLGIVDSLAAKCEGEGELGMGEEERVASRESTKEIDRVACCMQRLRTRAVALQATQR